MKITWVMNNLQTNFLHSLGRSDPPDFALLLWAIWKLRANFDFQGILFELRCMVPIAMKMKSLITPITYMFFKTPSRVALDDTKRSRLVGSHRLMFGWNVTLMVLFVVQPTQRDVEECVAITKATGCLVSAATWAHPTPLGRALGYIYHGYSCLR